MKRLALLLSLMTGSALAAAPDTYLEHGLNDAPELFNSFNQRAANFGSRLFTPAYPTAYTAIRDQASMLRDNVTRTSGSATPVVLVGHSMGGLRARQYAQYIAPERVRGIMTMGTPNAGAPIVNNAPVFVNRINTDLNIASFGLLPIGLKLFTGAWSANELPELKFLSDSSASGVRDMSPTSLFNSNLNNLGKTSCSWQSTNMLGFTTWYLVCKNEPDPTQKPISKSTQLVSVRGTNSDFLNMAPNYQSSFNMLVTLRNGAYALGAAYTAAAPWTFGATLPAAAASFDIGYIANNAHSLWRTNVMGSQAGDSIVPFESQAITAGNSNIGGNGHTIVDVDAVHVNYGGAVPNEVDSPRTTEAYRNLIANTSY